MDLPKSVQEIADVIGRERALLLVGNLPRYYDYTNQNTRVIMYVPKELTPEHRLVHILGWDDAQKLAKFFGGETLKPANCSFIYREFRERCMVSMLESGFGMEEVASLFNVCVRTVKNLHYTKPQNHERTPPTGKTAGGSDWQQLQLW